MAATEPDRRYAAFLSYSHRDAEAGNRLFRDLDGYRPPRALRGRLTAAGPVPDRLYPVFRDREELATSSDLSTTIQSALDASDNLIVLCSPDAAKSPWVNREIERFALLGRAARIHAVLLRGEPERSFPPALRNVGLEEPLAADLRAEGDGWAEGSAKLIAGILGIPFGELRDREVARARRRRQLSIGLTLLFAVLAIAALVAANFASERSQRIASAMAVMLEQVSQRLQQVKAATASGRMTTATAEAELEFARVLTDSATHLAPNEPEIAHSQANLLLELAANYQRLGRRENADRALAESDALLLRLSQDPANAISTLDTRVTLHRLTGDNAVAAGDRDVAREAYEAGLSLLERESSRTTASGVAITAEEPATRRLLLLRADLHDQLGLLARSAGDLDTAMERHTQGVAIRQTVAESNPQDGEAHFEWSAGINYVGDIHRRRLEADAARGHYEKALAIRAELVRVAPDNLTWLSGLARSYDRLGDLMASQRQYDDAIDSLRKSLELHQERLARDPDDLTISKDYATTLSLLAGAYRMAGDLDNAETHIAKAFAIEERALAADPANTEWRLARVMTALDTAKIAAARGDVETAAGAYDASATLARELLHTDDVHFETRFSLATTLVEAADMLSGFSEESLVADADAASLFIDLYEEAATVMVSLRRIDPANPRLFAAWEFVTGRLARAHAQTGNDAARRRLLEERFAIASRQSDQFPLDRDRAFSAVAAAGELAVFFTESGEHALAMQRYSDAYRYLQRTREVLASQTGDFDPVTTGMQRKLDEAEPMLRDLIENFDAPTASE